MNKRQTLRYTECFKRQVVDEIETGRFESAGEARCHYGIGGSATVMRWIRRYGKNHLIPKVIIVQTPDERREIERLRKEVKKLEQALGRSHVEGLLDKEFLKLACQDMGMDVESFKKKSGGKPDIM
jgi:transposase